MNNKFKAYWPWVAILVTCAVAALLLDQQGRLWICKCVGESTCGLAISGVPTTHNTFSI